MVRRLLESMARWRSRASTGSRPRLFFDEAPEVVYAVGDIHVSGKETPSGAADGGWDNSGIRVL